jgi:(p)ppGpp synthase/HD superfamily hydrolase
MSPSRKSAGAKDARTKTRVPQARRLFDQMYLPYHLRHEFEFLFRIKNKTEFLRLIAKRMPRKSDGYKLIKKAVEVARREFRHKRRHSGEPYFQHLLQCGLILVVYRDVTDPERIAAMFLHDLIEERREQWKRGRISRTFTPRVGAMVSMVTKPRQKLWMSRLDVDRLYYEQLKFAPYDVAEIKIVDRLHNLLTLWKRSPERMRRKVEETRAHILPLCYKYDILVEETEAVLEFIEHKLDEGA